VIGADVHVGSNCLLVAPVVVGDGATIGGGSVIAKDAPAGQLTVARAKQVSIAGWKRPVKQEVAYGRGSGPRCRDPGSKLARQRLADQHRPAGRRSRCARGSRAALGLDAFGDDA
jgi:carbonic anhydrase/acetyltransferase-like protein (isoleucine patch superfamily)